MILRVKDNARNVFPFAILSKKPNKIEVTPIVPIPTLSVIFMPIRFKLAPIIGLTRKTVSSKIPNTNPYSEGMQPFFSASYG